MNEVYIDIGGTFTKWSYSNEVNGRLLSGRAPTPKKIDEMMALLQQLTNGMDAVGIAVCGVVDEHEERVIKSANLPVLEEIDFKEIVGEARFILENDAVAACYGEAHFGAGKDYAEFILLTLGTAIGGAFYQKIGTYEKVIGQELSHFTVGGNDRLCACGRVGCLQTVASTEQMLRGVRNGDGMIDVFSKPEYFNLVDEYLRNIAVVLSNTCMSVGAFRVVVTGGIVKSELPLCEILEEKLKNSVMQVYAPEVSVTKTQLYDNASINGIKYLIAEKII